MNKIHKLSKILSILLVVGFLGALALYTHTARSSALQNMSGFAWGGDWTDLPDINGNYNGTQDTNSGAVPYEPTGGVGWISFNCTSGGNCGADDYGVNIEANGDLVGYAWSSNYGWLKFGDLSGFPTGAGVSTGNARLDGNELQGWARFCAGAADPVTCDGTVANPLNGGWDGWVSLKGPGYGVTLTPSTGVLSGFAWGGNDGGKNVVGWINFSTDFSDVIYEPVVGPTVSLTVESNSIPTGGQVELSWTGANLIESDIGCQASGGAAGDGWPGQRVSPEGTFTTNPISVSGTYTYSISCYGNNDSWSELSSVTVTVGVQLILEADNTYAYPPTYQRTLDWGVSPANGVLTNCIATNNATGGGDPSWSGPQSNPPGSDLVYVVNPSLTFTLTCQNILGQSVAKSVTLLQADLPESVDLWNNEIDCSPGLCTTTLLWEVVNAESCEASSIPPIPDTTWGGNIPASPNTGYQDGVQVPEDPTPPTTYRLECIMDSGATLIDEVQLNSESGASQPPIYQEN